MTPDKAKTEAPWMAPLPWNADWTNSALQTPVKLYSALYEEGMASASRLAKDHARHLSNLCECRSPSDILVYQTEFAEKALSAWFDEARRTADCVAKALATK